MMPIALAETLTRVEVCFEEVSVALVSGEPLVLVSAAAALQQASLDFSYAFNCLSATERRNKSVQARVQAVTQSLGVRRESLARRAVIVERSLNTLVPATQSSTYAAGLGPYGAPVKQTGAFKLLSA